MPTTARCAKHGLVYDPELSTGCVVCRRGEVLAPPPAPRPSSAPRLELGGRWVLVLGLLALIGLGGFAGARMLRPPPAAPPGSAAWEVVTEMPPAKSEEEWFPRSLKAVAVEPVSGPNEVRSELPSAAAAVEPAYDPNEPYQITRLLRSEEGEELLYRVASAHKRQKPQGPLLEDLLATTDLAYQAFPQHPVPLMPAEPQVVRYRFNEHGKGVDGVRFEIPMGFVGTLSFAVGSTETLSTMLVPLLHAQSQTEVIEITSDELRQLAADAVRRIPGGTTRAFPIFGHVAYPSTKFIPGRDHTLLFFFNHDRPVDVQVVGTLESANDVAGPGRSVEDQKRAARALVERLTRSAVPGQGSSQALDVIDLTAMPTFPWRDVRAQDIPAELAEEAVGPTLVVLMNLDNFLGFSIAERARALKVRYGGSFRLKIYSLYDEDPHLSRWAPHFGELLARGTSYDRSQPVFRDALEPLGLHWRGVTPLCGAFSGMTLVTSGDGADCEGVLHAVEGLARKNK